MTRLPPRLMGIAADYDIALRSFRLEFSQAGAKTCIALMLLGVLLDHAAYPQFWLPFLQARLVTCAAVFAIYLAIGTAFGRRHVQWLTFTWLLLPQLLVCWIIGVTDGAASIYEGSLTVAIFASGIVLAFGLWQNIAFGAISLGLYIFACAQVPATFNWHGRFGVNCIFILMSATASVMFTIYTERARKMLFHLRGEVANQNLQLERSNHRLAEIKGQLMEQEKMAALGTLAAGLMHEVNNPVNYCLMAIELAAEQPETAGNAALAECLADAKTGMLRVQHIVSDLKSFAYRKNGPHLMSKNFRFEHALDAALRLANYELKHVALTREVPSDTVVCGDEAAIIGVLINLFSNAVLAMQKGAERPAQLHIAAYWHQSTRGERLFVTVRDNGPGIAPQDLARVFEPFFTTRDVGQGLGLGLSISYRVIERHGGLLRADSALGQWTQIQFDLPRAGTEKH